MAKTSIRIDDRLIHGQTIVAWCPTLSIQEIIAIDDESARNPMLKSIMTMSVPSTYKTSLVTVEEAINLLNTPSDKNRLVIIKEPRKLKEIENVLHGVDQIILGNLAKKIDSVHKLGGATGIFYLSEGDVSILDDLTAKGFEVIFQQLPNTTKTSWESFKKSI